MANFTVRVGLTSYPATEDIGRVDSLMVSRGFSKTITSGQGNAYTLPELEYNYTGDVDRQAVLGLAKSALEGLASISSVLITESRGRTWSKLSN